MTCILRHIHHCMILAAVILLCHNSVSAERNTGDMFVRCEFSKTEFYAYESVRATIWLYSTNPEIAYVNEMKSPSLKKGEFSYLSRLSQSPEPRRERIKGIDYYVFPLSSYFFTMRNDGKYQMEGGEYEVGVNIPYVIQDPFYGRMRGMKTHKMRITMLPSAFKVKSLPAMKDDTTFSGAVGEFEVSIIVPEGNIIVNEDASLNIVVKGKGLLGSDLLPEYREAFGNGNKLKSFSERSNSYFDGKDIVSELVMECEFVPTDIKNCEIGIIRFGYFNPMTGKYEVAESEPVKIDVKSSAVRIEPVYI